MKRSLSFRGMCHRKRMHRFAFELINMIMQLQARGIEQGYYVP